MTALDAAALALVKAKRLTRITWHALDIGGAALRDLEDYRAYRRARRERDRWLGIGGAA